MDWNFSNGHDFKWRTLVWCGDQFIYLSEPSQKHNEEEETWRWQTIGKPWQHLGSRICIVIFIEPLFSFCAEDEINLKVMVPQSNRPVMETKLPTLKRDVSGRIDGGKDQSRSDQSPDQSNHHLIASRICIGCKDCNRKRRERKKNETVILNLVAPVTLLLLWFCSFCCKFSGVAQTNELRLRGKISLQLRQFHWI